MPKIKVKSSPSKNVTITYDLFDLPSAQHKAGLAGLILQIRSMQSRKQPMEEIPFIEQCNSTMAKISFTESSTRGLLDDIYDADFVESEPSEKPRKKHKTKEVIPPFRTVWLDKPDKNGQGSNQVTAYVYRDVTPALHTLRQYLPEQRHWLKLWRDMLWGIPRNKPQSRRPYEERAGKEHCKEGGRAWADLLKVVKAQQTTSFHVTEVAGTLWLGAQAANAEGIPFVGRAEQSLLLHFWPLTVLVFVPVFVDREGSHIGQQGKNDKNSHYALAIPEVSDLETFVADYPAILGQLGNDVRGYRPAEALIDLPAEGALAFMEHLAELVRQKTESKEIRYSVSAVEYQHLVKAGNNVKAMAAGRVEPRPGLIEHYETIAGRAGHPARFRNPLFRRGLLSALLKDRTWYEAMDDVLIKLPHALFVRSENSPQQLPWFSIDAARRFEMDTEEYSRSLEAHMNLSELNPTAGGPAPQKPLSAIINSLIRNYVRQRAEEKSGLDLEKFKIDGKIDWENLPSEFADARRRLAEGAFLEFRSRRDQAFVNHFVATFCSVKQYLTEDDYEAVAAALLDPERRDDLKTLTLLALSASS